MTITFVDFAFFHIKYPFLALPGGTFLLSFISFLLITNMLEFFFETKGMINMGTNFNDLWNDSSFISEDQRNKIDFEVALIGKLIEARESKGLSQK